MAPRGFTLPPAATASAKAARSAFFCDLCQKGYSRMNEFDAHESSYDHQHKKRLKEMKEMQRQVKGGVEGSKEKEKGPLMTIKLGGSGKKEGDSKAAGFKKGAFKNAFKVEGEDEESKEVKMMGSEEVEDKIEEAVDSDITDEEDYYDPRRPTGCMPGCPGHVGG